MRTFYFGKIIRDKIVAAMEAEGCEVAYRPLAGDERVQKLIEKLVEETAELADVKSHQELLEEIADVQLVLEALAKGLSESDKQKLAALHEVKIAKKGGFSEVIWVETVTVPEDNDWIAYFEAKPDKYPEQT